MTVTANPTKNNNGTQGSNPFVNATTVAAEQCCKGMNDGYKAAVDANQKFFNTFANAWTNPVAAFPFTAPTFPATMEKATKAMESMVEATAKVTTEFNTLAIEGMKQNLKSLKLTGDMVVGHMNGTPAKPAFETAREIFDEATVFANTTGEKLMKINADNVQRVTQIVGETMSGKCCGGK